MKNRSYVRDVFRNIVARSILAALIVFLLTVAATFVGGIQLYNSTKESIVLQGEVNAQQSAMSFDRYLLVRKNTVLLAGNVLNNMLTGKCSVWVWAAATSWFLLRTGLRRLSRCAHTRMNWPLFCSTCSCHEWTALKYSKL